jgi:hypothetical protein
MELLAEDRGHDQFCVNCVEIVDGQLSINVRSHISTADLLRLLGIKGAFEVVIEGDLGEISPQSFHSVALSEGLRRILGRRAGLAIFYKAHPQGGSQLSKVLAFEVPHAQPGASGDRSKAGVTVEDFRNRVGRERRGTAYVPPLPPPPPPPPR